MYSERAREHVRWRLWAALSLEPLKRVRILLRAHTYHEEHTYTVVRMRECDENSDFSGTDIFFYWHRNMNGRICM